MIANVLLVKASRKTKSRWKEVKENNLWPHVLISIFDLQGILQVMFLSLTSSYLLWKYWHTVFVN